MPSRRLPARDPWRVVILAYDGLCTFEFGIAVEVFALPRPELSPWYETRVASLDGGKLRATGGITIEADGGPGLLDRAGTIILPGWRDTEDPPPAALLRKLVRAHDAGARLVSICSGAFVLGATGLLDGKRATTHWRYADAFAACFPEVELDPDVLYVDEGNVITSAGSAAGVDACLHLVRRDAGAAVANAVARRLVLPAHRDGGQRQFVGTPAGEHDGGGTEPDSLARLCDWVRANLRREHSVESLARRAHVSPRTLARRFEASFGTTPHRWLTRERALHAQELLERTDLSVDQVAERCGFGDAQLLRHHFRRVVGATPSAYRRAFRGTA